MQGPINMDSSEGSRKSSTPSSDNKVDSEPEERNKIEEDEPCLSISNKETQTVLDMETLVPKDSLICLQASLEQDDKHSVKSKSNFHLKSN